MGMTLKLGSCVFVSSDADFFFFFCWYCDSYHTGWQALKLNHLHIASILFSTIELVSVFDDPKYRKALKERHEENIMLHRSNELCLVATLHIVDTQQTAACTGHTTDSCVH